MPSRKSGSSEVTMSDSRRTSLRRLSSIASFQTLFSRRRSNNATDNTANSSTSNLSLASTTVFSSDPVKDANVSTSDSQNEDTLTELPPPPPQSHMQARRSSYICLPDDPIGGMPRSRTFSNLPVPTRAKKTASIIPSKSHSRLPSAFLPSTRLPSPSISNRKHSHTRLTSLESKSSKGPPLRNRMKRSDTEPLLGVNHQQASHLPRSTAFKENISLSPIKPLPALDMFQKKPSYSSSPSAPWYLPPGGWKDSSSEASEQLLSESISSTSSYSTYAQHPGVQMAREYKSSPAYRSSRDRQPTPGGSNFMPAAAQRWNSQPILTNRNNNRRSNSQYTEIKQTRLMSARQAPTPPPPKTPGLSQPWTAGKPKHVNNSATHVRQTSEQTPLQSRSSGANKTPLSSPPVKVSSLLQISNAEPPAYWSGRLCALADRYRNEELAIHLLPKKVTDGPSPKAQTDKMHTPEASTARLKRALEYLDSLCATAEARNSLRQFQREFAMMMNAPELRPRLSLAGEARDAVAGRVTGVGVRAGASVVGGDDGGVAGMSENRKVSFMDRLLGRQKRRSLVLV